MSDNSNIWSIWGSVSPSSCSWCPISLWSAWFSSARLDTVFENLFIGIIWGLGWSYLPPEIWSKVTSSKDLLLPGSWGHCYSRTIYIQIQGLWVPGPPKWYKYRPPYWASLVCLLYPLEAGWGGGYQWCEQLADRRALPNSVYSDPMLMFEINCSRSIYIMEIGKCYTSGPSPHPHPELVGKHLPAYQQGLKLSWGQVSSPTWTFISGLLPRKTIHARVQMF